MSTTETTAPTGAVPAGAAPRTFGILPRWGVLLVAIVAQIIFAYAIGQLPILGLAQAVAILLLGIYGALRRDLTIVLCVLAYLTGCEVLWRQATVPVPYLGAAYLMILLSGFAVLVGIGRVGRDARLAMLYITLLLPAAINTIRTAGSDARELIAFAISGPFALAAFVAFTSQIKVAPWLYRRVLWITLISSIGPLTIAVTRFRADVLAAGGSLSFTDESNFSASGGFGPVQVSSVLSLGILAAVLLLLSDPSRTARIIAAVAAVALAIQTLLTFSRGGSFSVGIAVFALAMFRANDRRVRRRIIGIAAVALTLAYLLVFPWLESFTDGAFEERFRDTSSSRTELAANDTELFQENIVLGVGPGMTKFQRLSYEVCELRSDNCRDEASSHTEFTRMLGEHGIPGVLAIAALLALVVRAFARLGPGRGFAVAFLAWTIAQMFYANLRVTAVPFAFGMAFLRLTSNDDGSEPEEPEEPSTPRRAAEHPDPDHPIGFGAGYGRIGLDRADRPVGFGAGYGTKGTAARSAGKVKLNGHRVERGTDHLRGSP